MKISSCHFQSVRRKTETNVDYEHKSSLECVCHSATSNLRILESPFKGHPVLLYGRKILRFGGQDSNLQFCSQQCSLKLSLNLPQNVYFRTFRNKAVTASPMTSVLAACVLACMRAFLISTRRSSATARRSAFCLDDRAPDQR